MFLSVVTDTALNLPIYNTSQRVREIHVPKDYKTSTGALNKSRALQYCWEDSVNLYSDEEWIVHLDEETLVTEESTKGTFLSEGMYIRSDTMKPKLFGIQIFKFRK